MVLAVALPTVQFVLTEARTRRAAFLELAVERLGLENATVHSGRVEYLDVRFDACTARAFATLPQAWESARRTLEPGGSLVFFAGATERVPDSLPGASSIVRVAGGAAPHVAGEPTAPPRFPVEGAGLGGTLPEGSGSSGRGALASGGDLVIITA